MIDIPSLVKSTIAHVPDPYFPPNLTLFFKIGSGSFQNDLDGNPIELSTELIVKAAVRTEKPSPNELPGQIGANDIPLIGRYVEPKTIPVEIYQEQAAIAELVDSFSGQIIKGRFRFVPVSQNRFASVVDRMGMKIRGFLTVEGRT